MMKQLNDHSEAILGHSVQLGLFKVMKPIILLVTALAGRGERGHLGGFLCSFCEADNLLMLLYHWCVAPDLLLPLCCFSFCHLAWPGDPVLHPSPVLMA